jgi:hypothetical protein
MINTIHVAGIDYSFDKYGVIHQLNPEPFTYDDKYVSTYDTPEYVRNNDILQSLRWAFVVASHGSKPVTLVDFGYGNGAFLQSLEDEGIVRMGFDISGVELIGIRTVDTLVKADCYTFWDALEHVPDLEFIRTLPCKTICISLPWCHYNALGVEWFKNWKHRKPNEHLHHFDVFSLSNFMSDMGWELLSYSNLEDRIRKGDGKGMANILTTAFTKK